jgi:aspartokinase
MGCKCGTPTKAVGAGAPEQAPLESDFKVSIVRQKESDVFGMRIEPHGTNSAKIQSISDAGLIADWNMRNINHEDVIKEGDIIVAINGKHGRLDLLQDELKKESVTLSLKHGVPQQPTTDVRSAGEEAAAEPGAEPTPVEIEEGVEKDANVGAEKDANEEASAEAIEALEKKAVSDEQLPLRTLSATLANETDVCDIDPEPNSAPELEHKHCCVLFAA